MESFPGFSAVMILLQFVTSMSTYPHYQPLDVKEAIIETQKWPIKTSQQLFTHNDDTENRGKLILLRREQLPSQSSSGDYSQLFHAHMARDSKRVASLIHRLSGTVNATNYKLEDFGTEIVSGLDQGSAEFFVRVGIGSPLVNQYMIIDTGSDLSWVQCEPCPKCYTQTYPTFNPTNSRTFRNAACGSIACELLGKAGSCHKGQCRYRVSYGDRSYTEGTLAIETIKVGQTLIQNLAIGCGHINQGTFVGAAGVLGLGGALISFVGQLGGQVGGVFTYCLANPFTYSSSWLKFGREEIPVGVSWIPLIHSIQAPGFYYVGLSGLGVGGIRLPIPEEIFKLSFTSGKGGVLVDIGTAITRFPKMAYSILRDAFIAQTRNLLRRPKVSIFDTCYNLYGLGRVHIPTVSFYFSDGRITLNLRTSSVMIPVDEFGTFCFAFAPSSSELSIIGNVQQEKIQITIDSGNGYIGFGPNFC